MIFTERTITIKDNVSTINKPVLLYRGDYNIEIRFTILENGYKYYSKSNLNVIENTEAGYGQLVINTPNDGAPIFSEIVATKKGAVTFTITSDMIDESVEVGQYSFQIRLFDDDQESRATIPVVENGIEIREPIASEDVSDTNEVDIAVVNYAVTTAATDEDVFDAEGNYIKTTWAGGQRITSSKLNKIEAGISGANDKAVAALDSIPTSTSELENDSKFVTSSEMTEAINNASLGGGEVDLSGYAKTTDIPTKVSQLTNDSDFINSAQLNSAIAGITGQTIVEPEENDMPKVFFNGDKPTTKDSVYATIEYVSSTEHFKGYVDIKCQGTSSMNYPKKNYTIKMYTDDTKAEKLKKNFKGWGDQSKFCLKANYIDHSHARNIVSAKLWGEMVASRSDFDTLPEELRTSPNYGAVDGFPIKVYYNNTYEGVYTWNIPKDGWMNNMDDSLDTHCILCGEEYVSGCFRSANASLWSDELHDTMPDNIVTSFNAFQNFVINSTDEEFVAGLSEYADVNSLIDYYIFQYVICGLDSMGKNQLFFTYDGIKWIASSYDMDSTFGMYWNGESFVSAEYRMQEDYESGINTASSYNGEGNLLYVRLEGLFSNEIKTRYAEVRADILSYPNIVKQFENFMDIIGKDLYEEDLTIYTEIPSGSTNNIQQIRNYTRDRLTYVDAQIEALTTKITCTGITLDQSTLSFTSTDTQTLTATVIPEDCTETVTWISSSDSVATVSEGVVTPVASGNCTITATCGDYSAACTVTVAIATVECTSITLDQTSVELTADNTTVTLVATVEPSDCTEVVTWESNATNIATVDNGVVTAIANGDAIITATCGSQTATCNITISGVVAKQTIDLSTLETTAGYYNDTGVFSQWGNLATTDYIEMPTASGRIKHDNETAALGVTRVSYFDENKTYLGYNRGSGYGVASAGTGVIELDMDKGAKYFVVSSEDFSVLTYEYENEESGTGEDTPTENILQTIDKIDGYYNDGGVLTQWGSLKTTDYIEMPTASGRIKHNDETAALGVTRVSYFNEDKTYLGYNRGSGYGVASPGTGLIELDMDKGAKYFVVSSEDFSVLTYEYENS